MKIRPDLIEQLGRQEQAKARPKQTDKGFGDILAQEVDKSQAPAGAQQAKAPPPGARTLGIDPAAALGQVSKTRPATAEELKVMENIENLLDKWENYADRLKAEEPGEGLKKAYGMLQNIQDDVQGLKAGLPKIDNPNLQSVVDELEILTVAENIKFNRGDYL